jgi:hypothetical protein
MTAIALKQAGDWAQLTVQSCERATAGRYPELIFAGLSIDGTNATVTVPLASAERQFERLNLTQAGVVGKTLKFSRDPNKNDATKPYWGINLANGQTAPSKTAAAAVPSPEAEAMHRLNQPDEPMPWDDPEPDAAPPDRAAKLKAVFTLQEVCFTHALQLAAKADAPMTLEGLSALTAQAMIEASRRGC